MGKAEKAGGDRTKYLMGFVLLAALALLGISAYLGANVRAEPQAPQGGAAQAASTKTAQAKEVTIDFLYADWCPHCQIMKPIVANLEAALPKDRFEVRYWNEASRNDAAVAAVYETYTEKGYFKGYPTFVANGNDFNAGEMSEAALKSWVCSKFSSPKPTAC